MADFHPFAVAVNAQYMRMAQNELFTTEGAQDLFETYLAAFPPGTDPIFRVNTEHTCSCCKNFVRNLGGLVSLAHGKIETVWDIGSIGGPYDQVAAAMRTHILERRKLKSVYRTKERRYGAEFTRETLPDNSVRRWNHFFGDVAAAHFSTTPEAARGEFDGKLQVFTRGLVELKADALATIFDLIDDKELYRGDEVKAPVLAFRTMMLAYNALKTDEERAIFCLLNAAKPGAQFRNTAIGTLAQDLSAGMPTDMAVTSFEKKVAPENYKRPTALITPRMVQDAMKTINELGLEPALERRLATIADVGVNDVLWVDRDDAKLMKGGMADLLMAAAKTPAKTPKSNAAANIGIDDFMATVVPTAKRMDLFVANKHRGNFVTVTAPKHADAPALFKWDNGFAWNYEGGVTDSIREKVKKAGGDVDAKLRFSLAWFNYDDLDFHVKTPDNRHISFMNKSGVLDVDMNAMRGMTREPVENLSFKAPTDGNYELWVNQYNRRETSDPGFTVEIAHGGGVMHFAYNNRMQTDTNVQVGTFMVKNGVITSMQVSALMLPGAAQSANVWGVATEQAARVRTLMLSPNHWAGRAIGNKHWIFVLDGCKTDEPVRGIYNEFLKPELEKHRKVFEVLGNKTKCEPAAEQLSGLGFSSTRGDIVSIEVTTATGTRRAYNVAF